MNRNPSAIPTLKRNNTRSIFIHLSYGLHTDIAGPDNFINSRLNYHGELNLRSQIALQPQFSKMRTELELTPHRNIFEI